MKKSLYIDKKDVKTMMKIIYDTMDLLSESYEGQTILKSNNLDYDAIKEIVEKDIDFNLDVL